MPLKIRLQPPVSVDTPDALHIRLFVDTNKVAKLRLPSGEVVDLTSMVGSAGGDLSGTYPSPSVLRTGSLRTTGSSVAVLGSAPPTSGQVLLATTPTAAVWQDLPSLPPSGAAGGDLVGSYPSPIVIRTRGLKTATTTVAVSSATAPTSGQLLTAVDSSTATWQAFSNGTPTGSAGGDLSGSFPDPTVVRASSLKSATTQVVTSLSAAPTAGRLLVANSGLAAAWSLPSGELSGTWSAPVVPSTIALKSATTSVNVSASVAPISGRVLKASSGTAAAWDALDTYTRNSIWDPPLSADTADQEFRVDPFISGAWQVRNSSSTNIIYSRAGNIDVSTEPVSGTYRSTLSGDCVFLQVNSGDSTLFTSSTGVPSATSGDQLWMCGIGYISEIAVTAGGPFFNLHVYADSGGNPDINNRAFCGTWNPNASGVSNDFHCGVVVGGVFTQGPQFISDSMGVTNTPGFMIRKGSSQISGSGSNSITFGMFTPEGQVATSNVLGTSFSGAWSWVGITALPFLSSSWGPTAWGGGGIVALHFLRRKLGATSYIIG